MRVYFVVYYLWRVVESAAVNTSVCIPKTYFATEPPINKCSLGILGAFSDALGLDESYREDLKNRLTIDAAMKLIAYSITPESLLRPQVVNKTTDSVQSNLMVPSPVRSLSEAPTDCSADGHCELHTQMASQLRGSAVRVPLPDVQRRDVQDEFSNLTAHAFSAPPSLTEILVKDTLAEYLDLLNNMKRREKIMASADSYEPPRVGDIVNTLVNDELRGGAIPKVNLKLSATTKAKDDLIVRDFMNSHLVNRLVENVVEDVKFRRLNEITAESPMINIGTALCAAVEKSFIEDVSFRRNTCALMSTITTATSCSTGMEADCENQGPEQSIVPEALCSATGTNQTAASFIDLDIIAQDVNTTITIEEGNKDYWLYRGVAIASDYARRQAPCGHDMFPTELVPGWTRVLDMWHEQEGAVNITGSVPLAHLSHSSKNECDFMVTIRGTMSDYEWSKDFTATQTVVEELGKAHTGFLTLAYPITMQIENYLRSRHPECNANIVISGHSLGASVAHIVALLLAYHVDTYKISLVAFAAPQVLDVEATDKLIQRVTVRNWVSELDAIPQLPCATIVGLPRCDGRRAASNFGEGLDSFAVTPNRLVIPHSYLGLLQPSYSMDSFGLLSYNIMAGTLDFSNVKTPAPLQIIANHVCSYACYLSAVFCTGSSHGWMCNTCGFA